MNDPRLMLAGAIVLIIIIFAPVLFLEAIWSIITAIWELVSR